MQTRSKPPARQWSVGPSASLRKSTPQDQVFHIVNYALAGLLCVIVAYPLLYCVICSLSDVTAVLQNRVRFWPVGLNLKAYVVVMTSTSILPGFFNSVYYSFAGSAWAITLLFLAAYPMSRKDLPGRGLLMVYFAITMFFSGGMIPNYLLVRNLGMIGRRSALIVPFVFSCYNLIIVRTFMNSNIPDELLEVSRIDGCGDIRFFIRIAMPLSRPVLAVMILFHLVSRWNSYFSAMLYLTDSKMYPLQLVLREILFIMQMSSEQLAELDPTQMDSKFNLMQLVRYSALVIGALPMMIIYPFIQKNFIRGMLIGSIKG